MVTLKDDTNDKKAVKSFETLEAKTLAKINLSATEDFSRQNI